MGKASPGAGLPPGLLDELAAYHGTEVRDHLQSRLADIEDALRRPAVTLAFGGHFSSGKSTVINTLIGRALLPTSDFPETGAACVIRHGETERIVADTSEGLIELPFGPDALSGRVSLISHDGDYRQEIGEVRRILITLSRSAVPPGDTWIDSPGINDTELMTTRALEAAAGADTLIWVVNSRQPLSMTEEELLRTYLAEQGADAVVFLVNVFLREDGPGEWDRYLATRSAYHKDRIAAVVGGEAPPTVVFISGRAAGADLSGYGGPEARELLTVLSDSNSARIRAVRQRKAARELHKLAGQLATRRQASEARVAEEATQLDRWQADAARRTGAFAAELTQIVGNCFAGCLSAVEAAGTTLAAEMSTGVLRRDGSYSDRLSAEIDSLSRNLALELFEAIGPCAVKYGRRDLPSQATVELRALLLPGTAAVAVPDNAAQPGELSPRLEGMLPPSAVPAAERTVGWMKSITDKGRRTIDKAREAGKEGSTVTERFKNAAQGASAALQQDRNQAQAAAIAAAELAGRQLAAKQSEVVELALTHCGLAEMPPPAPDQAPVRVLATLISRLRQQAEEWDHDG
jgi:hypothetical protein